MTNFNNKDKAESRIEYVVINRSGNSITYRSEMFDDKDKTMGGMEFTISCNNEVLMIDMRNFIPATSMQQIESLDNAEVTVEGVDMTFPRNLSTGMKLDDSYISMKASVSGMTILTTTVETTERKVEGKEDITTSMGTFSCFKITSKSNTKAGFMKMESSDVLYLHPVEGFLRTETYDKKGRLSGYQVRTK